MAPKARNIQDHINNSIICIKLVYTGQLAMPKFFYPVYSRAVSKFNLKRFKRNFISNFLACSHTLIKFLVASVERELKED
jgi:hypothetical protein